MKRREVIEAVERRLGDASDALADFVDGIAVINKTDEELLRSLGDELQHLGLVLKGEAELSSE